MVIYQINSNWKLKKKSIWNTKFVDEALDSKNAITKASRCMKWVAFQNSLFYMQHSIFYCVMSLHAPIDSYNVINQEYQIMLFNWFWSVVWRTKSGFPTNKAPYLFLIPTYCLLYQVIPLVMNVVGSTDAYLIFYTVLYT